MIKRVEKKGRIQFKLEELDLLTSVIGREVQEKGPQDPQLLLRLSVYKKVTTARVRLAKVARREEISDIEQH